jgi:membrane peptidoglycan carboxypeptidase
MKKILISALILLISAIAVWIYLFHDLPRVDSLSSHLIQPSVRITDRNGQLLYEIIPSEGGRHTALAFSSIPQCIKDATIAVEDRNSAHCGSTCKAARRWRAEAPSPSKWHATCF